MENQRDDRVIFLKDLLFAALYQWRRILVAVLIFAVILGGFAGISEWKRVTVPQSEAAYQEELALYEEEKAFLEGKIENAKNHLESQKQYIKESPFMQLDAYNLYEASAVFSVQTDYQILPNMTYQNPDNINAILRAYQAVLMSDETCSAIAQVINVPAKYIPEILQVNISDMETRTLSLGVKYNNAEDAKAMLDAAVGCMMASQTQIAESAGKHQVLLSASSVNTRIDKSVIETQNSAHTQLESLRNTLEYLQEKLDGLVKPRFGVVASVEQIVLFAVLGGLLGAFLTAAWACIRHIAGAKVYSVRTLKNRIGIRILGSIPANKKANPVDKWLRRLEGRSVGDEQAAIVAATVRNYCVDVKNLLVVHDCEDAPMEDMVQALRGLGVQVTVSGSLLNSTAALEALPNCEAVLLMVQCGRSRYVHVEREIEIAADQSKLLGCVLVNG